MRSCVDIVRPFVEALDNRDDVQMIGGIGSVALTDPETVFVPDEKRVIAPADLALPQYRPDGNLRDFDALVLSSDQAHVDSVAAIGEQTIGEELELSFFGLKQLPRLTTMRLKPLRSLGQFVSDRYVLDNKPGEIVMASKALFPFEARMEPSSFETWRLYLGEHDRYPAPIPDPRTVIPNYLTRSISGLRPKDAEKVAAIADSVLEKMPDAWEWLEYGPGREQMFLARILQTISRGGSLAVGQSLVINPVRFDLRLHHQFMIADHPEAVQSAVLAATAVKAKAVHKAGSSDRLVTLWQRFGEKRVSGIIHND